jgi:signal transduction histidine kinase
VDDDDIRRRLLEAERALHEAREALAVHARDEHARRSATVARISGGIAHELNNPLTVLQLRTDLLVEDPALPEPLRQQLGVLRESIGRIARTVRVLQNIGRPLGMPTRISVSSLLADAARGHGRIGLAPVPSSLDVRGDPVALGLAIEQLVAWVVEAGGGTVTAGATDGRVWVELRADQASVVDGLVDGPLDSPDSPDARFPGIGLTVAAGIAAAHGGTLATRRLPGRGGVVRLELPAVAGRES